MVGSGDFILAKSRHFRNAGRLGFKSKLEESVFETIILFNWKQNINKILIYTLF